MSVCVMCMHMSKNDTDIAHYNFDVNQAILTISAGNSYGI